MHSQPAVPCQTLGFVLVSFKPQQHPCDGRFRPQLGSMRNPKKTLKECPIVSTLFTFKRFSSRRVSFACFAALAMVIAFYAIRVANSQALVQPDILIGQVADFSGPLAGNVKEGTEAVRAYFDQVNKAGGIKGRKIVLQSVDDAYDPKQTVALAKNLIETKRVLALILGRGTANAEAVIPLLQEKRVPMVGFAGGSVAMHTPPNRYFFNLRPPYRIETERAVGQLVAQGIKSVTAVYTEDAFGKDAVVGVGEGVAGTPMKINDIIALPRGSVDVAAVAAAVAKIMATKPGAIIAICTVKPCAALRKALEAAGYFGTFLTLSNTSSNAFVTELGAAGRGVIVTQVFPSPDSAAMAVSGDFQRLADAYKFPKSYTAMEGYVYARVLVEAIRRTNGPLTSESLTETLQGEKGFDLGGYAVNFGPNTRTGSQLVELTIISKGGKFMR